MSLQSSRAKEDLGILMVPWILCEGNHPVLIVFRSPGVFEGLLSVVATVGDPPNLSNSPILVYFPARPIS